MHYHHHHHHHHRFNVYFYTITARMHALYSVSAHVIVIALFGVEMDRPIAMVYQYRDRAKCFAGCTCTPSLTGHRSWWCILPPSASSQSVDSNDCLFDRQHTGCLYRSSPGCTLFTTVVEERSAKFRWYSRSILVLCCSAVKHLLIADGTWKHFEGLVCWSASFKMSVCVGNNRSRKYSVNLSITCSSKYHSIRRLKIQTPIASVSIK